MLKLSTIKVIILSTFLFLLTSCLFVCFSDVDVMAQETVEEIEDASLETEDIVDLGQVIEAMPEIYPSNLNVGVHTKSLKGTFEAVSKHNQKMDNIYYGVRIYREGNHLTNIVIDEWIDFDEPFSLTKDGEAGSTRQMEFDYDLPEGLVQGKYVIKVLLYNSNLDRLGWDDVTLNLSGDAEALVVFSQDREFLVSDGEEEYGAQEGLGIEKGGDIQVSVGLELLGTLNSKTVVPVLDIYERMVGNGDIICKDEDSRPITVNKGVSAQYALIFQANVDKAGVYEGLLYFEDETGEQVSEETRVRFVVPGASARILNVWVDDSSYVKGADIGVTVSFATSADALPPSATDEEFVAYFRDGISETGTAVNNLRVKVSVNDLNGELCGTGMNEISGEIEAGSILEDIVDVELTMNCVDPLITAEVYESDDLLDTFDLQLDSSLQTGVNKVSDKKGGIVVKDLWVYVLIVVTVLALAGVGVWYFIKYKK